MATAAAIVSLIFMADKQINKQKLALVVLSLTDCIGEM
jgi:hypothetical protein